MSGNEIKLTKPAGKTAEGEKVVFEKGKTTVDGLTTADGQTKFANKNTVFFYVTTKTTGNVTKIDSVDVYTGYSAAPDVDKEDNASAFAAYNKGGKMVAVAITSSAFNSTDLSDHVFIYKKDRTFTDYTEVRGFLAGMDQANTELKVSDNSNVDAADAVGRSDLPLHQRQRRLPQAEGSWRQPDHRQWQAYQCVLQRSGW